MLDNLLFICYNSYTDLGDIDYESNIKENGKKCR